MGAKTGPCDPHACESHLVSIPEDRKTITIGIWAGRGKGLRGSPGRPIAPFPFFFLLSLLGFLLYLLALFLTLPLSETIYISVRLDTVMRCDDV